MNNPGSDDDDLYDLPKFGGYASEPDEGEQEEEELEAGPTAIERALAALAEKAKEAKGGKLFAPAYKEVLYEFELDKEMNWEGLKALHKQQQPGAPVQGNKWSAQCDAVWAHMQQMYKRANPNPARNANGKYPLQSAYYGSDVINDDKGAMDVPKEVVEELKRRIKGTNWFIGGSNSSSAVSFKRLIKGSAIKDWNFLYKVRPPG